MTAREMSIPLLVKILIPKDFESKQKCFAISLQKTASRSRVTMDKPSSGSSCREARVVRKIPTVEPFLQGDKVLEFGYVFPTGVMRQPGQTWR